jgi:uncharacterized delta-60 repeat protein
MYAIRTMQGCCALLAGLLAAPIVANAAPGDLDPNFGIDGRVITDFGGEEAALAIARQSNGRIVVAGGFGDPNTGTSGFALARYRRSGQLDTSFSSDGRVTTVLSAPAYAQAVVIQPDDRIVVGGHINARTEENPDARPYGFVLARYKPNGQLDPSFGREGVVITERRGLTIIYGLALQPDGKIIAAGLARDRSTGHSDFALARYLPNGRLDASFGSNGVATTDFGGGQSEYVKAIALQPDGKIVAAGLADPSVGVIEFAVARYLPNGAPDVTFGGDGRLTTFVGDGYSANAIALQSDGKIVVGGGDIGVNLHFALVRYLPNGTLDPTFDGDGQLIADLGGAENLTGVAVQPDGRIVAAGWHDSFETSVRYFAVARFLTNGAFDTTFGGSGWVTTAVSTGDYSLAHGVLLQPNGKIVAAGVARDAMSNSDVALVRYLGGAGQADTDDEAESDESN